MTSAIIRQRHPASMVADGRRPHHSNELTLVSERPGLATAIADRNSSSGAFTRS